VNLFIHGLDCGIARQVLEESIGAKTAFLVNDVDLLEVDAVHPLISSPIHRELMGRDLLVELGRQPFH